MRSLMPGDAVLCSDGASAYAKAAAQRKIEHFVVGIKPFCGPATKYLNGYIRWLEVRMAGMAAADVIRAS